MAKKPKPQPIDPATAWHHAARKLGESVRFSFVCFIKWKTGCTMEDAEIIFESAVERGVIVHTGMAGLLRDVPKYKMNP